MDIKPGQPLPADSLFTRCDPAKLGFESTEDLEALSEIPGQDRALEAIRFATEIDVDGHNVYVLGPPGTGATSSCGSRRVSGTALEHPPGRCTGSQSIMQRP